MGCGAQKCSIEVALDCRQECGHYCLLQDSLPPRKAKRSAEENRECQKQAGTGSTSMAAEVCLEDGLGLDLEG